MATTCEPNPSGTEITFQQALEILSREERFFATVQAMNALLIQKGIYTSEEFEQLFKLWAVNQIGRPSGDRPGWKS